MPGLVALKMNMSATTIVKIQSVVGAAIVMPGHYVRGALVTVATKKGDLFKNR
jgi:hypothetical protein